MNKAYIPTLLSLILLAGLHFLASGGHWYVRYPGFDILMHILGGVGLALSVYWIIVTFFPKYKISFWSIIIFAFLAGMLWEVFENINNIAGAPIGTAKYYLDSVKDLCNDLLGALIVTYFLNK